MNRKLFAAVAAAFGIACSLSVSPAAARIHVFACESEWAALAKAIGGDDVTVHSATHGRQDAHYIRARPSLIAQIRRADVLICSGAELEVGWLPLLMQRGARHGIQPGQPGHIMAAEQVTVLDRPETIDRSLGDIHPSGNPHVHLDPENIAILATVLTDRLARIDPTRADGYRARLDSFRARWAGASEKWRARLAALRGMKVVVHHEAWAYFFRWSGLNRVAVLERVPGIPPSASHLREVLDRVRGAGVKAILLAPHDPKDAADWFSGQTGIPVIELPFTVGGLPEADDLFSLFEVTLTLLEAANDRP